MGRVRVEEEIDSECCDGWANGSCQIGKPTVLVYRMIGSFGLLRDCFYGKIQFFEDVSLRSFGTLWLRRTKS